MDLTPNRRLWFKIPDYLLTRKVGFETHLCLLRRGVDVTALRRRADIH